MADLSTLRGPLSRPREEEDTGGIISQMVKEIGKDLKGAAKVGTAAFFSPFDALGAEVPISVTDLETRDWTGAAMVASMFVGGGIASVARSVQAGQGLRGAAIVGNAAGRRAAETFGRRAGAAQNIIRLAGSEAAAGAFFGAVKPMERGEARMNEILADATLFGVGGAGMGTLGAAWKATLGGKIASLKNDTMATYMANTVKRRTAIKTLTEYAGVHLKNPTTGVERRIHRLADGKVKVFDGKTSRIVEDFETAVADSMGRDGFTEHLGMSRKRIASEGLEAGLPDEIRTGLAEAGGDLSAMIDASALKNYRAVREVLKKDAEADGLLSWLGAETITPLVDDFGVVNFSDSVGQKFRQDVLSVLPKKEAARLAKMDDVDFLREAMTLGAVDMDSMLTGSQLGAAVDELVFNGLVPEASVFTGRGTSVAGVPTDVHVFSARNPYDASVLSKFVTSGTLAKIHPEIRPLVHLQDLAVQKQTLGMNEAKQFIHKLTNEIKGDEAHELARIIDASADAGGVSAARARAKELARETGNQRIIDATEKVTDRLNLTRLRLIGSGRLGGSEASGDLIAQARQILNDAVEGAVSSDGAEAAARAAAPPGVREVVDELIEDAGRAGYFPIVNTGQIQAKRAGDAAPRFFDSWSEATRWVAEGGGGSVVNAMNLDSSISRSVSPREFGRLVKAVQEAEGFEITSKEAADILINQGTVPSRGPRKYSKHLQTRRLGLRDYAEDPLRGLDLYFGNTERTLAYNTFEREANAIIEQIPSAKTGLKRWAEDQRDLALGKPTWAERAVAEVFSSIAPEVSQMTLRRYSSMLRQAQGILKLGGFWSGIVNSTQFAVNTVPMLGAKYSAIGLAGFLNPAKKAQVERLIAKHKVDIGTHVNLTREGNLVGSEGVGAELKAAAMRLKLGEAGSAGKAGLHALENMWMFSFNTAERMNRLGTFWGAFRKGIDENMSEEAAVAFARDMVNRTQFDYGPANLPQALRGPVAGVLGQFKTFFINEMELIASLDNATRLKMMLSFQALGGAGAILALPGVDMLDAASRHFFDVKASEAIKLEGGEEDAPALARMAAFGVPGLRGMDLTNYVGPGGFKELTMGLLGPTVSDMKSWTQFFGEAVKDVTGPAGRIQGPTIERWLQRVLPAQLRRFDRGLRLGSGKDILGRTVQAPGEVRNPYSGKLIYRPEERLRTIFGMELKAGLGVPDVRDSVARVKDEIVQRETDSYNDARESFRRQIALARISGDIREAQRLQHQARGAGFVFTPSQLRGALEVFGATSAERREMRTPRTLRTEMEDFFAGT